MASGVKRGDCWGAMIGVPWGVKRGLWVGAYPG